MVSEPVRPQNQYCLQNHYWQGALETNFMTRQHLYLGCFKPNAAFYLQRKSPSFGVIRAESEQKGDGGWISKLPPLSVIHSEGDVVGGKYKIISLLGQGGVATTYEAEMLNGDRVALKAMSLRSIKGWKELDLFEREARVLKSLRHPGIPEYIDYFEVDSATDRAFYIVQMVAKGSSLADLIQIGWRATEEDVKRIAIEVLEILQYLGSLRPPVIHRDVKPENIILDEATGSVKLVDFGAVQDAAAVTIVGSTVVGTYGYMAPEQFQNRATVLSDLYGLGCTILFLISGKPPSSFPQKRLRIQFEDSLIVEPNLGRVLERLLEPAPEDRFQSAQGVIEALKNEHRSDEGYSGFATDQMLKQRVRKPSGTKVALRRTASGLTINIPALGFNADAVGSGAFALAWNAFVMFWTRSAVVGGAPLFFTMFSLPFWFVGVRLAKESLSSFVVSVELHFNLSKFVIEWSAGQILKKRIEGNVGDIDNVKIVVEGARNGQVITSCQISEGTKQHKFGTGLQIVELDWLVQEIGEFLEFGPSKLGQVARQSSQKGFSR
ncbi:hypothetical protein GOP47_0009280 [Adiantum capillus-veneris]|uniref:non-specific serine/threonine protein kinase n=1 Tax=Adiantum capillus-veneris TaxID=13818 RepID=A0A9D4ZH28_ADICA|nr:hypothetical protein GOP47_0009280 [Adiantum capillus-veneris]